jgi:hypothetical protein
MTTRIRTVNVAFCSAVFSCAALAITLAGCPDKPSSGGEGANPASSGSAATTPPPASASASASVAAAPAPPCTAETPFTIDKGARLDTGLTVTEFENGKKIGVGYAVGDGVPRVAMVDDTGTVTKVDPDWSHVQGQEPKKDPAMVRHVNRVTPLGLSKAGKMRVGMDLIDEFPTKGQGRTVRCGPADVEPVIADDGSAQFDDPTEDQVAALSAASDTDPGAVDFRDCRTFGNASKAFVLATQVKRASADNHDLLFKWVIDELPGKGMIKDFVVDHRDVKPGKDGHYPKVDHFVTPVAIPMGDLGVLITARDQGNIVFVKRAANLGRAGAPKAMWLGAAVGMPALNMENGQVYVATTEFQKTDLYGVLFPATGDPEKPAKIGLEDPNAPTEGSRDSASLDTTPAGDIVVAFIDGKAPNRHARLTVLGGDMKQKMKGVFDVSPADANVSETRVVALAGGKFLVTYLRANDSQLAGQLVSCKY